MHMPIILLDKHILFILLPYRISPGLSLFMSINKNIFLWRPINFTQRLLGNPGTGSRHPIKFSSSHCMTAQVLYDSA